MVQFLKKSLKFFEYLNSRKKNELFKKWTILMKNGKIIIYLIKLE